MSKIIVEEKFQFKGFGGCKSKCGLVIFNASDKVIVVLSQLKGNHGTSVTNAIEIIKDSVMDKYLSSSDDIVWYEHYGYGIGMDKKNSKVTKVTFDKNNNPMWGYSISSDGFKELYGYDLDI